MGKWLQELQECINRGFKAYFRDSWNYTDLALLSLFSGSMSLRFQFIDSPLQFTVLRSNIKKIPLRIYDAVHNANLQHLSRYQWISFEPRLIGEGLQAWGYVFVFIRLMGLMRVDRYLGE